MSSSYEIFLTDDAGRKICLMEKYSTIAYSRTNTGFGTCQFILPFDQYMKEVGSFPRPDMRIDVWRSPSADIPTRREGSFFIRKFGIYQRKTDNVRMIEIFGRSPLDILRRKSFSNPALLGQDYLDDMMRHIVVVQIIQGAPSSPAPYTVNNGVYAFTREFDVEDAQEMGPWINPPGCYLKNVLDILNDLKSTSFTLNEQDATNRKIYFDVIEDESIGLPGGFGYRFRTYADLRGKDRTGGVIFSTENGNLSIPVYYEDYTDEITSVFHYNSAELWSPQGAQSPDQYLSRWNYIEEAVATTETDADSDLVKIQSELINGKAKKSFSGDFLNSIGSPTQPRSLYGVDWDMGDLLPVKYAGMSMNVEVMIVYVAVNDQGVENISGKSFVGAK